MARPAKGSTTQTHTQREPPDVARRPLRLLTYVLHYDDLLAERTTYFALDDVALPLRLGRASDVPGARLLEPGTVGIPDRWMSRRHAVIERAGEHDVVRDDGSANGTFVNGARVGETTPRVLADGDVIEVGRSVLCYRVVDPRHAAALGRAVEEQRGLGPTRTFNPEVAAIVADLLRVAPSRESVLVLGETGTGKEVVAATLHAMSGRSGPLVVVDCGAVPATLFEGVFFGHRRGAYTGAVESRVGEIQRADGGTLFLDEVANTTLASQATLLRVIEDGKLTPLGETRPVQVDVRWVAATNRDLFHDDGAFRHDLLRRLAGHVVRLPPLRKRREDLGVLAAHLLRDAGVTRAAITPAAARRLLLGELPGNIRELRAALRAAALLAVDEPIDVAHLPPPVEPRAEPRADSLATASVRPAPASSTPPAPVPRAAGAPPSREDLLAALRETRGNVFQVAKRCATSPRQVYRWIDRYAIDLTTFRE